MPYAFSPTPPPRGPTDNRNILRNLEILSISRTRVFLPVQVTLPCLGPDHVFDTLKGRIEYVSIELHGDHVAGQWIVWIAGVIQWDDVLPALIVRRISRWRGVHHGSHGEAIRTSSLTWLYRLLPRRNLRDWCQFWAAATVRCDERSSLAKD